MVVRRGVKEMTDQARSDTRMIAVTAIPTPPILENLQNLIR